MPVTCSLGRQSHPGSSGCVRSQVWDQSQPLQVAPEGSRLRPGSDGCSKKHLTPTLLLSGSGLLSVVPLMQWPALSILQSNTFCEAGPGGLGLVTVKTPLLA